MEGQTSEQPGIGDSLSGAGHADHGRGRTERQTTVGAVYDRASLFDSGTTRGRRPRLQSNFVHVAVFRRMTYSIPRVNTEAPLFTTLVLAISTAIRL